MLLTMASMPPARTTAALCVSGSAESASRWRLSASWLRAEAARTLWASGTEGLTRCPTSRAAITLRGGGRGSEGEHRGGHFILVSYDPIPDHNRDLPTVLCG
jgi:hypothetical protein